MSTYIKKHWKGELSLAKSFWINLIGINFILTPFDVALTTESGEYPFILDILWLIFSMVVYVWQIVGVWRSSTKYIEETQKKVWAIVVRVVVVITVFATIFGIAVRIFASE